MHAAPRNAMIWIACITFLSPGYLGSLPDVHTAEVNPARLATEARFDLVAEAPITRLRLESLAGPGVTGGRMAWRPAAEQQRSLVVTIPVTHLEWTSFAVTFTATDPGRVSLALAGPWKDAGGNQIFKQEVLWDELDAQGTELPNGSFENDSQGRPAGWQNTGGVAVRDPLTPAFAGSRVARTWHNGRLSIDLPVTKTSITLRGRVRAARFTGMVELEPAASADGPAHAALNRFRRGVNFGNYLEVGPRENWATAHSVDDLERTRRAGFDHVRIPIGWHHYTGAGPEYALAPSIFAKADALVRGALKLGLNVIVNLHHFHEFTADPARERERFVAIWRQVAAHYADEPEGLALELLNEPTNSTDDWALNESYLAALAEIRRTNPRRIVFVGPTHWNDVDQVPFLKLPPDDLRLILTVHCYQPFRVTHQGASWAGNETRLTGLRFPGPPPEPFTPSRQIGLSAETLDWLDLYNRLPAESNPSGPQAFHGKIEKVRQYAEYYRRPFYCGEFGCYTEADSASRARYYEAMRKACEQVNAGWAIWDWKAGFRYWDSKSGRPAPGMAEALFGRPAAE